MTAGFETGDRYHRRQTGRRPDEKPGDSTLGENWRTLDSFQNDRKGPHGEKKGNHTPQQGLDGQGIIFITSDGQIGMDLMEAKRESQTSAMTGN
ncbi:uncharacterized protein isoform X2 [Danio rerio]|uniref:Uncharacterized protein isoform X2 n=1 Tax=Danio rerio TaxID=7955 RepID=A0AC58HPF4_DANRE